MASNYPTSLDNFTNPTSNDSLNSPSHSLQHANINDAVEAIEAKLGIGASTAGSATEGYVLTAGTGGTTTWSDPARGLTLIKTQTIGSAVSSVEVTGAFSSTYDNYKIVVSGGAASAAAEGLTVTLGSTATGYYRSRYYRTWSGTASSDSISNATAWTLAGLVSTGGINMNMDIFNPFNSTYTGFNSTALILTTSGEVNFTGGFLNNTTSYTAFTIAPASGTLTGGTIRVYGYRNS